MAAPKKVRSIQELAKSYEDGEEVSLEDSASKAARFKARRLARQTAKAGEGSLGPS
jgi:hypothetical protein